MRGAWLLSLPVVIAVAGLTRLAWSADQPVLETRDVVTAEATVVPRTSAHTPPAPPTLGGLAPDDYVDLVVSVAQRHGLDARIVAALVTMESTWNPRALGAAGERGLTQVLPSTHAWLVDRYQAPHCDLSEPTCSMEVGTMYLAMLQRSLGSMESALRAYNGGGDWARIPSTAHYARRILSLAYPHSRLTAAPHPER